MTLPRFAARVDSSLRVELPWPAPPLWPNRRVHWSKKAAAASMAKADAFMLTNSAIWAAWQKKGAPRRIEKPVVTLSFSPPSRVRYDLDNALSACKSALDGISRALDTDDSNFALVLRRGEVVKGGLVVVEIGV